MSERIFFHNPALNRYELQVDGQVAVAEYTIKEDGIVRITHVGVPKALEGQGLASQLTLAALEDIKKQGKFVFPVCPFVKTYILRHPEWNPLVKQPE